MLISNLFNWRSHRVVRPDTAGWERTYFNGLDFMTKLRMGEQVVMKLLGDKHCEVVTLDRRVVQFGTSVGPTQVIYWVLDFLH